MRTAEGGLFSRWKPPILEIRRHKMAGQTQMNFNGIEESLLPSGCFFFVFSSAVLATPHGQRNAQKRIATIPCSFFLKELFGAPPPRPTHSKHHRVVNKRAQLGTLELSLLLGAIPAKSRIR